MGPLYKVSAGHHCVMLTTFKPFAGLRLAHVRAIFRLPPDYPLKCDEPLAYIEWFTALHKPDSVSGYHHVTKSSRRKGGIDGPYAEIIPVHRIARNAMLVVKPGINLCIFSTHILMRIRSVWSK
jgi:hypothetical protein